MLKCVLKCLPNSCLGCFGYREDDEPAEYDAQPVSDVGVTDNLDYIIHYALLTRVTESVFYALDLIQKYQHLVDTNIVGYVGDLVSEGLFVEPCMMALVMYCGPFGLREALALIRENPPLLTSDLLMLVQEESRRQFVAMLMISCPHHPPRRCKTKPPFLLRMP